MTLIIIGIWIAFLIIVYRLMIERCEVEGCGGVYLETGYTHLGECNRCGHTKVFK